MKENNISTLLKVSPKQDNRIRSSKTANLWVLKRSCSEDETQVEVCGVIESIQRTIYKIEGKNVSWIRYLDHYYPLHSAKEFSELIEAAKKKKLLSSIMKQQDMT